MKSFVQLSLEEYEDLKQRAEQQDIPVQVKYEELFANDKATFRFPAKIDINMRELKLQICRQYGIDPKDTVVEFY